MHIHRHLPFFPIDLRFSVKSSNLSLRPMLAEWNITVASVEFFLFGLDSNEWPKEKIVLDVEYYIFNLNVVVVVDLVSMIGRVWKVTRVGNVLSLNPVFKWPQADACREFYQKMFRNSMTI